MDLGGLDSSSSIVLTSMFYCLLPKNKNGQKSKKIVSKSLGWGGQAEGVGQGGARLPSLDFRKGVLQLPVEEGW